MYEDSETVMLTFLIWICTPAQHEHHELLAVLDACCNHEGRPAHVILSNPSQHTSHIGQRASIQAFMVIRAPYLCINIKALLLRQQLDDVQVVRGCCPMDWEPAVFVFPGAQFGIDLDFESAR